ncbi:hypothetical protein O181_119690 [Austropuccinia psidii MF-1]|uniref:Uncharacterized protein n=1 Tax=Austropuccinia psidii MF-1 TaxID=1389203 RepID=A0A9Q3KEH6_9BASI|nr:hypothetical protein [Austropuccinia psidii MF-1]
MAIEPVGPSFGHGPPWSTISAMASGTHQRPSDQLSQPFPHLKGDSFHSSMHPVLKVAGVVHIWYYIPFCTIFAQQFNVDAFRTKFHNSNSRSQNLTPISKEDSVTHQSGNQKTIQGSQSPGPAGVGLAISFRIIPRAFSEVIQSFNQCSRHQVFHYSLDNSIGPYRRQSINLYVLGPIGPIQSHSSIS